MTKAATVHMTKMLATHLSETNVRVNSIAPCVCFAVNSS